jgi:hypothetical protein
MEQHELQLVTMEQAKKLKNLGFEWKCRISHTVYNNKNHEILYQPEVALAMKWLRDVKNIKSMAIKHHPWDDKWLGYMGEEETGWCNSYEEAEIKLLNIVLKILKP